MEPPTGRRRVGPLDPRTPYVRLRPVSMESASTIACATLALAVMAGCGQQVIDRAKAGDLTCGSGTPHFSLDDLRNPPSDPAEDAAGLALGAFLASPEAALAKLPDEGWIRVRSGDKLLFLTSSRIPDAPLASVVLRRDGAGWVPETWGSCLPRSGSIDAGPATWNLAAPLDRRSSVLEVLVSEIDCSSGTPADDRVLPPMVTYSYEAVTVTFWVSPLVTTDEAITCVAPPPTDIQVRLREPVGKRNLLDGGVLPPRAVHVVAPDPDPGNASPGPLR